MQTLIMEDLTAHCLHCGWLKKEFSVQNRIFKKCLTLNTEISALSTKISTYRLKYYI